MKKRAKHVFFARMDFTHFCLCSAFMRNALSG